MDNGALLAVRFDAESAMHAPSYCTDTDRDWQYITASVGKFLLYAPATYKPARPSAFDGFGKNENTETGHSGLGLVRKLGSQNKRAVTLKLCV